MPNRLQRLSTAVPWPRGIAIIGKTAYVLARGVPRRPRGPHPLVFDRAGTIFAVSTTVWEWVTPNKPVSKRVRANAKVFAPPDRKIFKLWGRDDKGNQVRAPWEDIETDRPYATLVRDAKSRNFFICGFSGIDNAPKSNENHFRKNATDAILRFDQRNRSWHEVERHNANMVPKKIRMSPDTMWFDDKCGYYPNNSTKLPHGLLNGPDGLLVFGNYLLAVAKDNDMLARYSLDRIRKNPEAGPPRSDVMFKSEWVKTVDGRRVRIGGYSSLAVHDGMLYLGGRDKNLVVRMPITDAAELDKSAIELVADLGDSASLIDLAFNSSGQLFASTAWTPPTASKKFRGAIWKIPTKPKRGDAYRAKNHQPWFKLEGKCTNIAFDSDDRLYVCTNKDDIDGEEPHTAGTVYRIIED